MSHYSCVRPRRMALDADRGSVVYIAPVEKISTASLLDVVSDYL